MYSISIFINICEKNTKEILTAKKLVILYLLIHDARHKYFFLCTIGSSNYAAVYQLNVLTTFEAYI